MFSNSGRYVCSDRDVVWTGAGGGWGSAVSANRRGWEGYPSSFGGQRAVNGS